MISQDTASPSPAFEIPFRTDSRTGVETETSDGARIFAAVIALQSSLDHVETLAEAGHRVAAILRNYLAADRVIVLWRFRQVESLHRIGDSRIDEVSAAELREVLAAGEEMVARGGFTCWPASGPADRHALLATKQWATSLRRNSLIAITLANHDGVDVGLLVVLDPHSSKSAPFLRVASSPLASTLLRIARYQPSRIEQWVRQLKRIASGKQLGFVIIGIMTMSVLMAVPVRYRVSAPIELQPKTRRFIAVPLNGSLQSVAVRPGDIVAAGDLLAAIDPREIDYQLAGSTAEWNRAEQERKTLMAKHDFAGSKLAELESERLRLKTELLRHQRDHLEIRSPIAGVVVSGDLLPSEGMPMTRGETLLEIAPLGEMIVEISIPENELAQAKPGMPVEFIVNAYPHRKLAGEILRIHPSAELREHQNVFVAEVGLDDVEGLYRPGMRGRATITGDRHPLAWNLFHHAWFAAQQWIGW